MSKCLEEMEQGLRERAVEWGEVKGGEGECVAYGKAAAERPVRFPMDFVFVRNAARKYPTNPENPAQRCNVPSVDR